MTLLDGAEHFSYLPSYVAIYAISAWNSLISDRAMSLTLFSQAFSLRPFKKPPAGMVICGSGRFADFRLHLLLDNFRYVQNRIVALVPSNKFMDSLQPQNRRR
ncbi:hypothetical protein NKJ73_31640 [Mesorhizobium sp. M0074]|uniref:hypothetical protein n=1 Tax=Mesorhizobium sp. M0074 TaxID=2956869 RepID=UPI0033399D67